MQVKYAVWREGDYVGDFQFLTSSQSCLTNSLEGAKREVRDFIEEQQNNYEPKLTKKQVLEDGRYIIYKLTMEVVK